MAREHADINCQHTTDEESKMTKRGIMNSPTKASSIVSTSSSSIFLLLSPTFLPHLHSGHEPDDGCVLEVRELGRGLTELLDILQLAHEQRPRQKGEPRSAGTPRAPAHPAALELQAAAPAAFPGGVASGSVERRSSRVPLLPRHHLLRKRGTSTVVTGEGEGCSDAHLPVSP